MAVDPNHSNYDDDPLENTELARRLRRMEWPPAPVEVRERVLQRIVAQRRSGDRGDGGQDQSPSEPSAD